MDIDPRVEAIPLGGQKKKDFTTNTNSLPGPFRTNQSRPSASPFIHTQPEMHTAQGTAVPPPYRIPRKPQPSPNNEWQTDKHADGSQNTEQSGADVSADVSDMDVSHTHHQPNQPTTGPDSLLHSQSFDDPNHAGYVDPIHRTSEGFTLLRLSLPGNDQSFDQGDFRNSIYSHYKERPLTLTPARVHTWSLLSFLIARILNLLLHTCPIPPEQMATDLDCTEPLTVFPRGASGPYDVRLPAYVAAELLILKEIDIMKLLKNDEQVERTFFVNQLTTSCDIPVTVARAQELSDEQERRREEAREKVRQLQREKRETENRNTLRIYLELDGSHGMGPPGLRSFIEREFNTAIQGAFGNILSKVTHHRPLDEYKPPKSSTTFFLHLTNISLVSASHFSTLKYRQVSYEGVDYKPAHSRIHESVRNTHRFATCCYRPGCEGPQTCEIKRDVFKRFRNLSRGSLFNPDDIPEWKRERLQREVEASETTNQNAKRALNILAGKSCKKHTRDL